jgi:hypothetical protein
MNEANFDVLYHTIYCKFGAVYRIQNVKISFIPYNLIDKMMFNII